MRDNFGERERQSHKRLQKTAQNSHQSKVQNSYFPYYLWPFLLLFRLEGGVKTSAFCKLKLLI